MNIPTNYTFENLYNSSIRPSTIHSNNAGLTMFYRRYLLQKLISVFKWKLPEAWDKEYFYYTLYCLGWIAVIRTDRYGVICQQCGLQGFNLYYRPTEAVISNPLLRGILTPKIGLQTEIIKMQPDYFGALDIINFYADMLAVSAESAGLNLLNTKLAYVFASNGKAAAESFKKLFDEIASGSPAVVIDKKLFNEDGSPNWILFNQQLKNTYIAGDILEDMKKWELKFDTDIGIPNANTDKKERLITDEVNSNNVETYSKVDLWLATMKDCCEKVNKMFDIGIDVELRYPMEEGVADGDAISNSTVQSVSATV